MNKKRLLLIAAALVAVILVGWAFSGGNSDEKEQILTKPTMGDFEVSITTTGELRAKNSVEVLGPMGAQKAQVFQIKIANLVPEGTVVKKGDFIAELDRSEMVGKLKDVEANLQKHLSEVTTQKLDCTLTLAEARENIINLKYGLEDKKINLAQSKYEPPAIQRQAEIEAEKAERALDRALENYSTKVRQAEAKVMIAQNDLSKARRKLEEYQAILDNFKITAPENGMVIYYRDWNGRKRVVGSMVRSWYPVVATLPDLSVMESVTWVNEVDIQKVKEGQTVEITLDSDPDKVLNGKVTQVANIGEQRPNSDSKVFEVVITVTDQDSTLRPAMTTSNYILVERQEDVLSVPLECIHSNDSISFVYKKSGRGIIKQQIKIGLLNENEAVIENGLSLEDELYLSIPDEVGELELSPIAGAE